MGNVAMSNAEVKERNVQGMLSVRLSDEEWTQIIALKHAAEVKGGKIVTLSDIMKQALKQSHQALADQPAEEPDEEPKPAEEEIEVPASGAQNRKKLKPKLRTRY